MAMWIRATPAMKVMIVQSSKMEMTARTKGSRRTPPPGAITSAIKEPIVIV